jgi:CubicO group peptidase (beta-lactamase class C family)
MAMSNRSRILLSLACALLPSAYSAEGPSPEPGQLRKIPARMREFVDKQELNGAVTLVTTRDRVVHLEAVGSRDVAGKAPMKTDSIFWIASMTKPTTGVAVLMLLEQGKLSIDDPVGKYIPELANLKTGGGKPVTVTLKHMLTHTSGLAEASPEDARSARRLAELIPAFASKPVFFEPGSQWKYCQSGINSLARVVEVVSGEPYADFLSKRLLTPLGMKDTTFYLSEQQVKRLVTPVERVDGKLVETPVSILYGKSPTSRDRYPAANGGLFSTASDYARFARMLLNGGTLDGKQYLMPETVKLMASIHTGDLKAGFVPGSGWGLAVGVVREPVGITAMLSPGTYGHGGAYGTQAWMDPEKGIAYIMMIQRAKLSNSDASEMRQAFQETAAALR